MRRRRVYFGMLAGWVVILITLTSIPDPSFQISFRFSDKIAHFGFYGVAGFLCALWRRESGRDILGSILFSVAFFTVLGAADEVHQHWIPGRSMEFLDWVADVAGGTAGALFAMVAPSLFPFLLSREIQSSPRAFTD